MSTAPKRTEVPRSVWDSSYISAGLAIVLVLELIAIGGYVWYRVDKALDPENLADRAEQAIQENYPELREKVVVEIKAQAPQIAEQVSQQAIDATPEVRQELEEFTARQLAIGLDQATELSTDEFRELLRNNRETIEEAFERIEAAPDEAHELVLKTEANVEKQLGVDVQKQAKAALSLHRELNDKLERLADPKETLSGKELLERRIVRILRTMQEEELNAAALALRRRAEGSSR